MRIAVYNEHWATAGGGERFAVGIATSLARRPHNEVVLAGPEDFDVAALGARFGIDCGGLRWVEMGPDAASVGEASAGFDLFVNASYGSDAPCRAPIGIYVTHFPVLAPFRPGRVRRTAISALTLAARAAGAPDPGPTLQRAAIAERVGWLPVSWAGDIPPELDDGSCVLALVEPVRSSGPVGLVRNLRFVAGSSVGGSSVAGSSVAGSSAPAPAGEVAVERGIGLVAVLRGPRCSWPLQLAAQLVGTATNNGGFLDGYQVVAANSAFTAAWVRTRYQRVAEVLYPPVTLSDPASVDVANRRPAVLSVGRFFPPDAGHGKRQLELVEAFRRLLDRNPGLVTAGWTLQLAGGCDRGGEAYLAAVRAAADGLPVEFHVDVAGPDLRRLYEQATVYWHAAGLGVDEDEHPERLEHFGITTVEAMSAGAVPIVIGRAGQRELFENGTSGWLVDDLDALVEQTRNTLDDEAARQAMASRAVAAAARFAPVAFDSRLDQIVQLAQTRLARTRA